VTGTARGSGFVAKVTINGQPVRFDLAKQEIAFDSVVSLGDIAKELEVIVEDLLGTVTRQTVSVTIDREGPAIAINTIATVKGPGEPQVRITGVINDQTGIATIRIGDRQFSGNGVKEYALDLTIPFTGTAPVKLVVLDTLGNETVAEFNQAQELAAFSRRPERLLLAFNGSGIFNTDHEPPRIVLKDTTDLPSVFVDRFLIDGELFDNSRIERVTINGMALIIGRGKKVFFSKIMRLQEGKNRFVIEAYDAAGNRSQAELLVNRVIPQALQLGSRMSVSLLPFDGKSQHPELLNLADDFLLGGFVEQKRFQIIERQKLQQVLTEQKLTQEKLTDPAHSVRIGKLIAADALLATSVREDKKSLEIIARVINTETAEVMEVKDVYTEDKSLGAIKEAITGLAAKIASGFPLAEGMIIGRDKKEAMTDLGSSKIRKSMGAIIYRKGKEVRHPVTGRSLGADTIKLGDGWFDDVQPEFSRIRLSDRARPQEITVKDLLISR
jgi:hypothetical protein